MQLGGTSSGTEVIPTPIRDHKVGIYIQLEIPQTLQCIGRQKEPDAEQQECTFKIVSKWKCSQAGFCRLVHLN